MSTAVQILASGLTLGALYAISAAALSLLWGTLKVLNMAQGAMLSAGGYASYTAATLLGWPPIAGLLVSAALGAAIGLALYAGIIRFILDSPRFETAAIIATIGFAIVVESVLLKLFGAYPLGQPLRLEGAVAVANVTLPTQNLLILAVSAALLLGLGLAIAGISIGRQIRATAQNREAALLMGVSVHRVYAIVLLISGALSALSGVLVSSLTTLSPTMGYDPMVKGFVICVLAGLGSLPGTLATALALGLIEATIQYTMGVRYGLPVLLLLVIAALIWRPSGLFGSERVQRL